MLFSTVKTVCKYTKILYYFPFWKISTLLFQVSKSKQKVVDVSIKTLRSWSKKHVSFYLYSKITVHSSSNNKLLILKILYHLKKKPIMSIWRSQLLYHLEQLSKLFRVNLFETYRTYICKATRTRSSNACSLKSSQSHPFTSIQSALSAKKYVRCKTNVIKSDFCMCPLLAFY